MKNAETIARKNKVAQDYIDKISNEKIFENIKEIDKSISILKKDTEKMWVTNKTKYTKQ